MATHCKPETITVVLRFVYLIWNAGDKAATWLDTAHYRARTLLGSDLKSWAGRRREPSERKPENYQVTITVELDDPDAERIVSVQDIVKQVFDAAPGLPELVLFDKKHPPRMTMVVGDPAAEQVAE